MHQSDFHKDTTLETFQFNFAHNTTTVFEMMQHAIPYLRASAEEQQEIEKNRTSCIVNVSSVNGLQSFGGTAAYCASKAAVDQLTRCAAVDLAPFGVRVNAVNPGVVVTELQKRGGLTEDAYKVFLVKPAPASIRLLYMDLSLAQERSCKTTHPLKRVGQPEEVLRFCFLARLFFTDGFKHNIMYP